MTIIVGKAMGIPQVSATSPRRVTPSPPVLMANPTINPEARPSLPGKRSWAITTVTEKLATKTNPERAGLRPGGPSPLRYKKVPRLLS
jgi:hypothetical protein